MKSMTSTTTLMCNNAPLTNYFPSADNPWDGQKVIHLYRRAGFGATPAIKDNALTKTPGQVVNAIIQEAIDTPPEPAPEWANWSIQDFRDNGVNVIGTRGAWSSKLHERLNKRGNLHDRLVVFWSNHIVASLDVYWQPPYMYEYLNLLQKHAIGNFKDMVREIGLSSAMLTFLNGFQNRKGSPNENYARELYELFTLGVDNGYTQEDIVETARAFTGWNDKSNHFGFIKFNPSKFDDGEKTIFGRTGNWGYDDVIDILFEEREQQIAKFICKKLYQYFVSPTVSEGIVQKLADIFVANNFEIAPVLKRLFKSQHFFDDAARSVIIKSPADLLLFLYREMDLKFNDENIIRGRDIRTSFEQNGQAILKHISVEGWATDRAWIDSSSILNRWFGLEGALSHAYRYDKEQFKTFINRVVLGGSPSNDVEFVTKSILDFFFTNKLTIDDMAFQDALVAFKDTVPEQYFKDGSWNTNWDEARLQMYRLMQHIVKIPEFQLK